MTKFKPVAHKTRYGWHFTTEEGLPIGTDLFTAAQMRQARVEVLERAADSLELYCGEPEIAAYVRALIEQEQKK